VTIKFKHRQLLAITLLTVAILFAGWSAIPDQPRNNQTDASSVIEEIRGEDNILVVLDNIGWLHVVVHSIVFGSIGFLIGPWGAENERGSILQAFFYVIIGTIIWETVQATVFTVINGLDNTDFNWAWFSRVLVDFFVNILSASIVVAVISIYQHKLKEARTKNHAGKNIIL